jgi:hypothetical protein
MVTETGARASNSAKLGATCETNAAEYSAWACDGALSVHAIIAASDAISSRRPRWDKMGPVDFIRLPMRSRRWQLDWSYRASFIAGVAK